MNTDTNPAASVPLPSGQFIYTPADGSAPVVGDYKTAAAAYAAATFTGSLKPTQATVDRAVDLHVKTVLEKGNAPGAALAASPERTFERAATEIAAQEAALNAAGFATLPEAWFPAGTSMIKAGKDKYKALAKAHEDLPLFEDAAAAVAYEIRSEKRTDIVIDDVSKLRMDEQGRLSRDGKRWLPIEEGAFAQLLARFPRAFPSARAFLSTVAPDLRAECWNRQAADIARYYPEEGGRSLKLRGRRIEGLWRFFAALSLGYTSVDGDVILTDYSAALAGQNMKGSIVYNRETTGLQIRASWNAPKALDAKVGDVFRVGLYGSTRDNGTGAHYLGAQFTRIICINCTTADARNRKSRQVHRGAVTSFRDQILASVAAIPDTFAYFADAWGIARTKRVSAMNLFGEMNTNARGLLQQIAVRDVLETGADPEKMEAALLAAYAYEPGDTAADVVNAITRAAWQSDFDELVRVQMERKSSELVYAYAGVTS